MIKRLKQYVNRETVAYLITGVLTTVISMVVYLICARYGYSAAVSNTVSTVVAVAFAYITNKIFVFKAKSWEMAVVLRELFSFCAGRFVMYAFETLALALAVDRLGLPNVPCKCVTTAVVVVCNYIISKKAVFIKKG